MKYWKIMKGQVRGGHLSDLISRTPSTKPANIVYEIQF